MSGCRASPLPRAEFETRLQRIETLLEREKLDALIGYSVGNQAGPVAYLAGYEPRFGQRDVAAFVLVPGKRSALVLYAYWDMPDLQTWTDDVQLTRDLGGTLQELLPSSVRRVGIAGYAFFPAPIAASLGDRTLVDATPLLMEVARVKSAAEIALVYEATRQTDAGLRAFLSAAAPGTDERDLALAVHAAILRAGADRLAFPPLLFSGELSETGIGFPRPRVLEHGDQVNLVCGAALHGYNSDVGRVAFVGPPSPSMRPVLESAEAMHAALLDAARPGQTITGLAQAGVDVVRERGHADWLYRFGPPGYSGHAIGCWLDEAPRLAFDTSGSLEPNMIVVLEARLGRENGGGVTLTDPVLITEHAAERLSNVPVRTWECG
jgi:Xaa-Pro aminopeptidase